MLRKHMTNLLTAAFGLLMIYFLFNLITGLLNLSF